MKLLLLQIGLSRIQYSILICVRFNSYHVMPLLLAQISHKAGNLILWYITKSQHNLSMPLLTTYELNYVNSNFDTNWYKSALSTSGYTLPEEHFLMDNYFCHLCTKRKLCILYFLSKSIFIICNQNVSLIYVFLLPFILGQGRGDSRETNTCFNISYCNPLEVASTSSLLYS